MIHTFNMSVTSIPDTVSKSTAENHMTVKTTALFVPILTVLAEVGGPFIWIARGLEDGGVGACLCDSMGWDESYPLSEGLFQKFADWAFTFDDASRDVGYTNDLSDDWDWVAFHARGLQLSRWLKEEVGDAYRVVYMKYRADPSWQVDERMEVQANGGLIALPSFWRSFGMNRPELV